MKRAATLRWLKRRLGRPGRPGPMPVGRPDIIEWTKDLVVTLGASGFLLGLVLTTFAFSGESDFYLLKLIAWSVSLPIMFWIMSLNSLFGLRTSALILCALLFAALLGAPKINQSINWVGMWVLFLVFLPAILAVLILYTLKRAGHQLGLFRMLAWALQKIRSIKPAAGSGASAVPTYGKYWAAYLLQTSSVCVFFGSLLGYAVALTFWSPDIVVYGEARLAYFIYAIKVISFPWSWLEPAQLRFDMFECVENPCSAANSEHRLIDVYRLNLWLYMLSAQCFYILLLRLPVLCYAGLRFHHELGKKAPCGYSTPSPYLLIAWEPAPEFVRRFIEQIWGAPQETAKKGDMGALVKRQNKDGASGKGRIRSWIGKRLAKRRDERPTGKAGGESRGPNAYLGGLTRKAASGASFVRSKLSFPTREWLKRPPPLPENVVILVKSSNPPMWDLDEGMQQLSNFSSRMVLPLDWNGGEVQSATAADLKVWRQACAFAPGGWTVLQPRGNS